MRKKRERTVSLDLDPASPAPLTRKQKAELAALANMPDEEIDYSDIPRLPPGILGEGSPWRSL